MKILGEDDGGYMPGESQFRDPPPKAAAPHPEMRKPDLTVSSSAISRKRFVIKPAATPVP